jgi:prevent-host-death family protein
MAARRKKKAAGKSKSTPARNAAPRVSEPVSLYDAKTRLSELVDLAAAGQEFIIAKSGMPMAKLVPLVSDAQRALRVPGQYKGKMWMSDDFDTPTTPEEFSLYGIDPK